ncbi:DUF4232 domain-containing protein [Streptomyces sp. NPDC093223]|uniref:DUF4232 domain-containing protein n=1 Tax=Streptomyces sp. NPDC093223 TaxID=3366033 RepID=UPI00380ED5DC
MSNRRRNLRRTAAALAGAAALMAALTACDGTASGSVTSDGGTAAPAAGDSAGGTAGSDGSTGSSNPAGSTGSTGSNGSAASGGSAGSGAAQAGNSSGSGRGTGGSTGTAASGGSAAGSGSATAACQASGLGYSWADTGSGSGQKHAVVALTNKSGRTCTLYGFPGVDLVDGGRQWSLRRTDATPQRVTLASGAAAHFTLTYLPSDAGDSTAFTPTTVVITAPDQRTSFDLPWHGGPVVLQDGATHPGTYVGPVGR